MKTQSKTPSGHKRKPQLYLHAKTESGWRYLAAPPDEHDTLLKQYPAGVFYIRQRLADGRRVFTKADPDNPVDSLTNAKRRATSYDTTDLLESRDAGRLKADISKYIQNRRDADRNEAAENSQLVLAQFVEACPKVRRVKDITEDHLTEFVKWLRNHKDGYSKRTISNKYDRVRSFLKFMKHDVKLPRDSRPKYEKTLPTTYSPEQIHAMLKHADEYMALVIDMGRQLGLREQEMAHAEWSDVLHDRHFRVQSKEQYGFEVKDSEQRDIPIPSALHESLKAWRKKHPKQSLILGIGPNGDRVNGHLLRWLQRVAKKANVPGATLHKLRRNYISTLVESNKVSVRTAMHLAGHSDLASTMRYLRPTTGNTLRETIDSIF